MDKIGLYGIRAFGRHGYSVEERAVGQTLEVDVILSAETYVAGGSDHLADTIDYGEVFRVVTDVVGKGDQHLLEAIAAEIARQVVVDLGAAEALVRVSKLNPPVGGPCDRATVEITRSVKDFEP